MRAAWQFEGADLTLALQPDVEDTLASPRPPHLRMVADEAHFRLPWPTAVPHPDLLALAALSVAMPWTARRLRLDRAVSADFAAAAAQHLGIEVSPVGADSRRPGTSVSLCFSGGADSVAVSTVLPDDSPHVHLRRVRHPAVVNRMTHVRADVIERIVGQMGAEHDRDISIVQSDLEYLCLPYATYPTWWAVAIGSVLTADHLDAAGVATGTVLESAYLHHGTRWTDGKLPVRALFAAAGLPLVRPAAGMTEAVTARICLDTPIGANARSCLLGSAAGPCLRCVKCMRKELLVAALTDTPLSSTLRARMNEEPKVVREFLDEPPLHMQNIVEFALARVDVSGTPLEAVRERLQPTLESTAWVQRYYGPALADEVPEQFRGIIEDRLRQRVGYMTETERTIVETWDAAAREPAASPV